jgi:hypothetical protein
MPPTRTAIEPAVTLEALRRWSNRSLLFSRAWGFGFLLVSFVLVIGLADWGMAAIRGSIPRGFHVAVLWWLFCNCLAVFVAGIAVDTFLAPRIIRPAIKTALLAGLTFLLFCLFAAITRTAFWNARLPLSIDMGPTAEMLFNYWWNNLANLAHLLAVAFASVIYLWLPKPAISRALADETRQKVLRRRDLVIGGLLVVVGFAVALLTWVALVYESQKMGILAEEYPPGAAQLRSWGDYLQRELWIFILKRSLPFIIVGALLLATSFPRLRPR